MYQAQIDEALKHQIEFFEGLDKALADKLFFASADFPDLKERIMQGLRWGLFLRPNIKPQGQIRTSKLEEGHFLDFYPIARINFPEIKALERVMSVVGLKPYPIFSERISDNFVNQELEIYYSYDSNNTVLKEIRSTLNRANPSELAKQFELRLTLPSPEDVFDYKDINELSDWQMEVIEDYEDWKFSVEKRLNKSHFQIGGNGNWAKRSVQDNYIAQINNEVEDGSSLFILMDKKGEFESLVGIHA